MGYLCQPPARPIINHGRDRKSNIRTIMLCGTFVFAIITAPKWRIMVTIAASSLVGENALPTYPIVESTPLTLNWSLRETGSPWKGPIGFPSHSKYLSSSRARWTASSKRISVKQFVCAVRSCLRHNMGVLTFLCASIALPFTRQVSVRFRLR